MARIGYQLMPPEYEEHFKNNLAPNFRFELPRIMRRERLISREKRERLIEQSFLPKFSLIWDSLSAEEKEAWNIAGASSNIPGWRLFVKDQSIRISYGMEDSAVPSKKHQARVGHISLTLPADRIKLVQPHPRFYWVSRIASGRYPLKEIVWIHEPFSLPLRVSLNYKANLVKLSDDFFVHFYVLIWSVAGGRDFLTAFPISLSLNRGWGSANTIISSVRGVPISYDLYFELFDVSGDLFFDNISVEHNGANWANDSFCESIDAEYSGVFFQVLRPWIPLRVPTGASYESAYFDFDDEPFLPSSGVYGLGEYGFAEFGNDSS